MLSLAKCLSLACTCLVLSACGRTPLLPPTCDVAIAPVALDFGSVPPGQGAARDFRISNRGVGECHVANLGISPSSDDGFSTSSPRTLVIAAEASVVVSAAFQPADVSIPVVRAGELSFDVDALFVQHARVPLTGKVLSSCTLAVAPTTIDFGHVALDSSVAMSVQLTNTGTGPCQVGAFALGPSSDAEFTLAPTADPLTLAPGEQQSFTVTFAASDASPPHHRTGTLVFASTDDAQPTVTIPLAADIDIGCDLTWSPTSLDFGTVNFNTRATGHITLGNDGSDACLVSGITIAAGGDVGFSLPSAPSTLTVGPGGSASIDVMFTATDSSSPHAKTGLLVFQTGNRRNLFGQVPLSATVNTACVDASRWIYTLGRDESFARFDPDTLTFTEITLLHCPNETGTPNSMAVDQHGAAWVAYQDGNLFKVDLLTGACQATGFVTDQHGMDLFGMGFVFDPATSKDTLYIAGGKTVAAGQSSTLATISFPDLVVTPVGTVVDGFPELTGTGDGQLWGFIPPVSSIVTRPALLLRLDPNSGATLESHSYPTLTGTESWAVKFWGGYFWLFLDTSIYKVSRDSLDIVETAMANTGRSSIVGAGVSTCAPLQ